MITDQLAAIRAQAPEPEPYERCKGWTLDKQENLVPIPVMVPVDTEALKLDIQRKTAEAVLDAIWQHRHDGTTLHFVLEALRKELTCL